MRLLLGLLLMAASISSNTTENPVALYKGLGYWHHPITTNNSEAQKFFDQGLMLAYSFNRYEALRSFERASNFDPHAAMPYWGIAMAQGPYVNMDGDPSFNLSAACAAAHTGMNLKNVAEQEKAYLHVALSWCPAFRADAYVEAARQLTSDYPNDLDTQVLLADSLLTRTRWHWYDGKGKPSPGVTEAETVLQDVLRRWPQHPGANHLYIHAVESSASPERGIASAQRLMGLVPWAGHMVHMPAHIWLVLGDWEMAASLNDRAVGVDREYFDKSGVHGGSYEPYYLHNMHFVLYARSMQGNKAKSLVAAEKLRAESAIMQHHMPEMADSFGAFPILIHARFRDWRTILELQEPSEAMPATHLAWRFSRILALAHTGDSSRAQREYQEFERARKSLPPEVPWGANNNAQTVMQLASEILASQLTSDGEAQCEHLQRAVRIQDDLVYDEPPGWYYPVRESLGSSLLRFGQVPEAIKVFQEGVRRSPRNGRMLFGLKEALRAGGKNFEADSVEREFRAAWSQADVTLGIGDL